MKFQEALRIAGVSQKSVSPELVTAILLTQTVDHAHNAAEGFLGHKPQFLVVVATLARFQLLLQWLHPAEVQAVHFQQRLTSSLQKVKCSCQSCVTMCLRMRLELKKVKVVITGG